MDAGALVYVPDATYGWLPATVVSDASGGASRSGGGGATTTTVTVRLDGDPSTILPRGVACLDLPCSKTDLAAVARRDSCAVIVLLSAIHYAQRGPFIAFPRPLKNLERHVIHQQHFPLCLSTSQVNHFSKLCLFTPIW